MLVFYLSCLVVGGFCSGNNHSLFRFGLGAGTWKKSDGSPMVDYSEQMPGARIGNHIDHVDLEKYRRFRAATKHLDFDMMLEIKDKEKSALLIKKAIEQ